MKKWNYTEYRGVCKIKKEVEMETETESSFKRAFKHIIEVFEGK